MCEKPAPNSLANASNSVQTWAKLLGAETDQLQLIPVDSQLDCSSEFENQIARDVQRTRGTEVFFQSGRIQRCMVSILVRFCNGGSNMQYMQGLNEVLAPFLWLDDGGGDEPTMISEVFFERFVNKMMPLIFHEEGVTILQCLHVLNDLVIKYHDPEVAAFLEQCGMASYIYVNSWFVTYFARKCSVETTLKLWKLVLELNQPTILVFLGTAFLYNYREAILTTPVDYVPELLTKMTIPSSAEMVALFATAVKLMRSTPSSVQELITRACFNSTLQSGERKEMLNTLQQFPCVMVGVREVAKMIMSLDSTACSDHIIMLDCRPYHEFSASHLAGSVNIRREDLEHLKQTHKRVFAGNSGRYSPTVCLLTSCRNMPYVRYIVYGLKARDWSPSQEKTEAGSAFEDSAITTATLMIELGFEKVCLLEESYGSLLFALEGLGANIRVSSVNLPTEPIAERAAAAAEADSPQTSFKFISRKSEPHLTYQREETENEGEDNAQERRPALQWADRIRKFFVGRGSEQQPGKTTNATVSHTRTERASSYRSTLYRDHVHAREDAVEFQLEDQMQRPPFKQPQRHPMLTTSTVLKVDNAESVDTTPAYCPTERTSSDLTISSESTTGGLSPLSSPLKR